MPPVKFEEYEKSTGTFAAANTSDSANTKIFHKKINQTLVLIDSRPLVRWCLSRWLQEDFDRFQILTLSSPINTASRSSDDESVELVVWSIGSLSLSQPSSLQDFERVKLAFPNAPIVMLADREDAANIAEAIRHGSRGYIPTSLDKREIAEILRFVQLGGTFVPSSIVLDTPSSGPNEQASSDPAPPFDALTPRELQVVELVRQAKSNKIIAYDLDLSESTVKVIVHRILNKLNAANRTELACLALKYLES